MQRAVECTCGEHFEARTDAGLFDELKKHADEDHPDWTDADIKAHLTRSAYDGAREGSRA
jgi:hypothetical protein